jgi:hypothetical protein
MAASKSFHVQGVPDQQQQRNLYIPSIDKARTSLQLDVQISLEQAITHTGKVRSRKKERMNLS